MTKDKVIKIIVPTWWQALASTAAALGLLSLIYNRALANIIAGEAGVRPGDLQASFHEQLTKLGQFPLMNYLFVFLFWVSVGIVLYFTYLTLANFVITVRNEYIVDTEYVNEGGFASHLPKLAMQAALTTGLAAVLLLSWKVLIPSSLKLFERSLLGGEIWLFGLVGIAGFSLSLYLIWTMAQLTKSYE